MKSVFSVTPMFAWYDFWIGAFYDQAKRRLYIFPLPMLGVMIQFPCRHEWKADMVGVDLKAGTAERFVYRCSKCPATEEAANV